MANFDLEILDLVVVDVEVGQLALLLFAHIGSSVSDQLLCVIWLSWKL